MDEKTYKGASSYFSYEYKKFRFADFNRNIERKRVDSLKRSIEAYGWLNQPILVNEFFEIIDGQHRFVALMELGMPIHYIIAEGAGAKDCNILNNSTNPKWSTKTGISVQAKAGNTSYRYLGLLITEFEKKFKLNSILYAAAQSYGGDLTNRLANGSFTCSEYEYTDARKRLDRAAPFLEYLNGVRGNKTVYEVSLIYLASQPEIDHEVLRRRMDTRREKFVPCATVKGALEILMDAYNYGTKRKVNNLVYEYNDRIESLRRKK